MIERVNIMSRVRGTNKVIVTPLVFLAILIGYVSPIKAVGAESKPYLGVYLKNLDATTREAIDFTGEGVLVQEVIKDSPADRAGLKSGDIITRYQGIAPRNSSELQRMVTQSQVGAKVDLEVWRDGKVQALAVVLEGRPDEEELEEDEEEFEPWTRKVAFLGISGRTIEGEIAQEYFGVEKGALIEEVTKDSPAQKGGLKSGDVIVKFDGKSISTYPQLVDAIREHQPGDKVEVEYIRKGKKATVKIVLGERDYPYIRLWHSGPIIKKKIITRDGDDLEWEDLNNALKEALEELKDALGKSWKELEQNKELQEELKNLKEELRKLKENLRQKPSSPPDKTKI